MAIVHHKVTGMLTLFIADQITDEDHQLDEVNLSGTVTWKPVFPKGMSQAKASGPARLVSLKPIKSLVADGLIVSLSGTVSEIGDVPGGPGQELPVMIDDTPVWWECSFDVAYEGTAVRIPSMLVDATEGDVDITTLVSAGGFPEVPMDDIEAVIATVRSMSRAAEDAIRRAEDAASKVGEVDEAARDAVKRASEAADAAHDDAERAEAGAAVVGDAQAVLDARDAAAESARAADESAGAASSSASSAASDASRASSSAGDAAASAGDAAARAKESDQSAKDAAAARQSALDAQTLAEAAQKKTDEDASATAENRTATAGARDEAQAAQKAAETAQGKAEGSATAAKSDADRAEQAASSVDGAAVEAVTKKVDELTKDAPEKFDTLKEIADALDKQEDMGAVLTSQIAGKADREHTHTMVQVDGLNTALAAKAATTVMNARPALFSGAGAAPSTIAGAVVGDWWLNTTTMELSKITGV
jgi:hypothetical protein